MHKKIIAVFLLIVFLVLFVILINSNFLLAVDNVFDIQAVKDEEYNLNVTVQLQEKIEEVRIYKKNSEGTYITFLVSKNINSNVFTHVINKSRLSTTEKTYFRVWVKDEKGNVTTKDITGHVVPKMTPKPTPTPSVSQKPSTSAKPTTSQAPSTSAKPTTSSKPSTSTAPATTGDLQITLDKTVLMLSKTKYKKSILRATVTPSNAKVRFSSNNPSIATVNSKNGTINAKGVGTTKIKVTATLKGKTKTAVCKIHVITTMTENVPKEDGAYFYNRRPATYYILGYKDKNSRSPSWTDEEVESYINNAAWLVKTYPDEFDEGSRQVWPFYPTHSTADERRVVKKKGQISPNEYLLLFTTKNQWLYLFKKNSKGVWKLNEKMRSSGGYYNGNSGRSSGNRYNYKYVYDVRWEFPSQGIKGWVFPTYWPPHSGTGYNNSLHISSLTPGYPTSGGCIHLGDFSSKMYKKIVNICHDQQKTLTEIYY